MGDIDSHKADQSPIRQPTATRLNAWFHFSWASAGMEGGRWGKMALLHMSMIRYPWLKKPQLDSREQESVRVEREGTTMHESISQHMIWNQWALFGFGCCHMGAKHKWVVTLSTPHAHWYVTSRTGQRENWDIRQNSYVFCIEIYGWYLIWNEHEYEYE